MSESPGYIEDPKPVDPKEFEHLEPSEPEAQIPDPDQFPEPEDMSEADQKRALKEHRPKDVGGPGGIVNYPEKLAPEDWEYVEGESTPKEEKS